MKLIGVAGDPALAQVYVAESDDGKRFEFVESLQPPYELSEKWIHIVSTLYGCPVHCRFCDAGSTFRGRLSLEDLLFQTDTLVHSRFSGNAVPVDQWKIQFARMGDPAFNPAVLEMLELLPSRYDAPGLMPSISTIGPASSVSFLKKLKELLHTHYSHHFQFQYSLHTTDPDIRQIWIPTHCLNYSEMAEYGDEIWQEGGRKITLNFILAEGLPIDAQLLRTYFDPKKYILKVTPLNPTFKAQREELRAIPVSSEMWNSRVYDLLAAGFDVIESVGELEENAIGSNCGQYISAMQQGAALTAAYTKSCIRNMVEVNE